MDKLKLSIIFLSSLSTFLILTAAPTASGDELDQVNNKLESIKQKKAKKQTELEKLKELKKSYQQELTNLKASFKNISGQLTQVSDKLKEKEKQLAQLRQDIKAIEDAVDKREYQAQQTIRRLYINEQPSQLPQFLAALRENFLPQTIIYNQTIVKNARQELKKLNQELAEIRQIKALQEQIKEKLEDQQQHLAQRKQQLESGINQTQNQLTQTQNQQNQLQQALVGLDKKISQLTKQQQEILAAKAAAALKSTSVGNTAISRAAISKDPPKDGKVYFSFWTYGYPHRVGMSQYGALGRAMTGQTAEQIIKAYYHGVKLTEWDGPEKITIKTNSGQKKIAFEQDYLLGIGEMPSCWGSPENKGFEALKAQAIASRTYAIKYTQNGQQPICTTQACQVYVGKSKVQGKCGEYWKQAVKETRGLVVTHKQEPISAWYASTAGGFTLSSAKVWGGATPYAQGIKDFDSSGKPYEKIADSPWYHKAWGDQPWLSREQVADLFNAALLPETFNDVIDNLSSEKIVAQLRKAGIAPVQQLESVEILDEKGQPGPNTAEVGRVRAYFSNNQVAEVSGSRFKFVFNLRSPGTDAIWTTRFHVLTAAEL